MFTALASSLQVRLSSSTNTQGLPLRRLTYIAFAELELHVPFVYFTTSEMSDEDGAFAVHSHHWY